MVPPDSITVFLECLSRCSAIGNELVKIGMRRLVRKCTIWKVVVPPLMMIGSPSLHSSTASRAIARFCAALSVSLTEKGRPARPMNCGGEIASAPPRTRRSRFCTCSAAMSRRIVASDESVRSTISCTVTTGFSWTADRMILWRSFSCMVPPCLRI